jgi:hypothetical protein
LIEFETALDFLGDFEPELFRRLGDRPFQSLLVIFWLSLYFSIMFYLYKIGSLVKILKYNQGYLSEILSDLVKLLLQFT